MSVDKLLAVAAAADGGPLESRLPLLIIGLGLSAHAGLQCGDRATLTTLPASRSAPRT